VPRLTLEDGAHGLVTYTLDEEVLVLGLADRADVGVAPGTASGFVADGLAYANDTRLRLIPFDQLPLP